MFFCAVKTVLPAELGVGLVGGDRVGGDPDVALVPGRAGPLELALEAAVVADDGSDRQAELAPPDHVRGVAEGADHGDAGALVGLGQLVGDDRDLDAEQRRDGGAAEQRLVALVVGVGDHGHARRQQLGAGRVDPDDVAVGPAATGQAEGELVVGAGQLAVLELGLGDRRSACRRPTAWGRPSGRRCPAPAGAGRPSARCGSRWVRSSCTSGPSRPTARRWPTASWYSSSISCTTCSHSSTKLGREIRTGSFGSLPLASGWGGVKSGSYGRVGSQSVAVSICTRRSTFSPLSSHPIG